VALRAFLVPAAIATLLAPLPCAAAAAPTGSTVQALADLEIKTTDAVQKGFGGAILIDQKGEPVLRQGYGFADRDRKIPFTVDTVAQIGSITKSMTALAILELVREGKFDLEKSVRDYLPGAAEPAASATLHQLLTHHAGLTDICGDDFDRVSRDDLLRKCMALPLAYPPGSDHYSNMGYSFLAALVEQASGQNWEDRLRDQIWQPLGMDHTGFVHFTGLRPEDYAHGYLNDQPQDVISEKLATLGGDDWNLKGNGGIQASTTDMERFYRALSGKLPGIPREIADAMTTPHDPIGGEAWEGYGLFVRLDARGKPYRIGFSGSDGVFFSYFGWLPQQDVFFYVVGNNGEANVKPVVGAVLKAALKIAGITPDMLQKPSQQK
jgi:CubicO group peptidase (beta-lactamase class C family)